MPDPDLHSVIPVGLLPDEVEISSERVVMTVRSAVLEGCCPDCGNRSARVHSRYVRHLLDLPSHGRGGSTTLEIRAALRGEGLSHVKHYTRRAEQMRSIKAAVVRLAQTSHPLAQTRKLKDQSVMAAGAKAPEV
ncbi:transposase family protein [Roseomonas sp. CAU 1739]|uniref:transposase family protein n=1 Tax=Roseomonas sp. CAU 1739 TaxID=3140364 RepID=UPI00325A8C2F